MGTSNLVAKPIVKARTRKRLAPSEIRGPLVFLGRHLFYLYLRYALRFRRITVLKPEKVVRALIDFQENRTRLIVAFRHPYGDEAQLMFHVMEKMIPRYARRLGTPLKHSPGLRTLHDYAVALWGDAVIRYIMPRVGALPIYHVKYDSKSVRDIRAVMRDGPNPLGIASEGQISYHAETLPRIEQGTVRMGFWCAGDLEKAGRPEHAVILPLSVHHQYDERDMGKLVKMLRQVETACGIEAEKARLAELTPARLLPRVERAESRMLKMTEDYYGKTYGYRPPESPSRHERWAALQPFALSVAEHALGIDPKNEDDIQRMYRVRQAAWDNIYPETPVEGLCPLEAALADRRTGEAWYAMRHMELVDLMGYHDEGYFTAAEPSTLTFDRLVETVCTLKDLANRLMGGNIVNRPNLIRKNAVLVPGDTMDLTAGLPDYRADSRQTVRKLTEELAREFENCIEVYRNGQNRKFRRRKQTEGEAFAAH